MYYTVFNTIKYLTRLKIIILSVASHNYGILPLEKSSTLHNDVVLVKSHFYKNHKQYYYKIF